MQVSKTTINPMHNIQFFEVKMEKEKSLKKQWKTKKTNCGDAMKDESLSERNSNKYIDSKFLEMNIAK